MDPHFLTDQQQKQRGRCSKDLLKMFEPANSVVMSSHVMELGCTFMASLANGPVRCRWLLMGRDQLWFNQDSRVGSRCFPSFFFFFSNTRGPVIVVIPPQNSMLTTTCYVETVLPGETKSVPQQCQTIGTSTTLRLHDDVSAHKAKVTVTFLKKQNI